MNTCTLTHKQLHDTDTLTFNVKLNVSFHVSHAHSHKHTITEKEVSHKGEGLLSRNLNLRWLGKLSTPSLSGPLPKAINFPPCGTDCLAAVRRSHKASTLLKPFSIKQVLPSFGEVYFYSKHSYQAVDAMNSI